MAEAARAKNLPVDDKVHTWPHLVRGEFLMALFVTVVLTLWSITIDAPWRSRRIPPARRIRPRRRGIFSVCRRCSSISIPGTQV